MLGIRKTLGGGFGVPFRRLLPILLQAAVSTFVEDAQIVL